MSTLVVSGWSAVSPFGIGAAAFAEGIAGEVPAPSLPGEDWGPVPAPGVHLLVPEFSAREALGKKGTRSMDRVSALAVTTVGDLLSSGERHGAVATGERAALVLGTTTGSVKSMMDITRDTLIHEKPFYIDAARIPNAIMNSAAAQCAIWHELRGPNTTVAGGRVAPLFAMRYAMRLLEADRAGAVLCGGAEEFSAARAWLEHHGRTEPEPGVLSEGCALFLLEHEASGAEPMAEVLAVETGVHGTSDAEEMMLACLRRAFARAEVALEDTWAVSSVPCGENLGAAENAALAAMFGSLPVRRVPGGVPWGDAGAVTAAFQLAAVLAEAERDPAAAGRVAVIAAMDRDGVLGCALLRMGAAS